MTTEEVSSIITVVYILSTMSNQRQQVNCRIEESTLTKLKALANGYKYKACPTCGRAWDLHGGVKTEPVQHSVLASQLLEKAIDQLFQDSQK